MHQTMLEQSNVGNRMYIYKSVQEYTLPKGGCLDAVTIRKNHPNIFLKLVGH